MYCLGQARVAEWLPSWPQCDSAVSTWRWPSPSFLQSAQLACQVLQATWSIKHFNDDHSLMHSYSRPLLMMNVWECMHEYMFFFFFPVAQRSLTCIQLVSEGRFWLGPDTWWYKSPLEFKGVPFVQAILQKAFKLNKSTDAPMFQNTAFTASYFISISYTVEWKWQNYLKMATSLGEHSNNHFHICWSLISLYLQWIREVCYVTRQVYYVLSPWGWDHEVQMTAAGLGVCTSWVKMWGQGMRLGLRGHTRSSSSHRNYLRAVFTSGDHRGPVSSCFSNRVD